MSDIFIQLRENTDVSGRPPFGASRWRATAGRSPFGVSLAFRPSTLRPRAGTPLFSLGSPLFTQPHCPRIIGDYFVHFYVLVTARMWTQRTRWNHMSGSCEPSCKQVTRAAIHSSLFVRPLLYSPHGLTALEFCQSSSLVVILVFATHPPNPSSLYSSWYGMGTEEGPGG